MAKSKQASGITVAGIGASAGGIQALQEFFAAVPDDLGLSFVVVVHLAPHHESELSKILARKTRMTVTEVGDDAQVIAPNRKLEISDTTVGASPFDEPRGEARSTARSLPPPCGRSPALDERASLRQCHSITASLARRGERCRPVTEEDT